ncbi:DUF2480 family protein [Roseivirga echinicomitans]|uniref:DUF2480 family protein n=1 Tax=Roseivirga echinicomitans TaxID=296218 RepID=A0A150XCP5_9BACT|nr:DUF2480 family protein [Roseivirga echinicomitans]KYG76444.1 hypothetical protein AWN68_05255 [Roseivirga echinicomitans]
MEEKEIVNRVANSSIVTIDLEDYYHKGDRVRYDIAQHLYQGLILKEMDFRDFVKEHDWSLYEGKNIALFCSEDAIVPTWAYMLLTTRLQPYANKVVFGGLDVLEYALFKEALSQIDLKELENRPVVVKGCGDLPLSESAFVELTSLLQPVVKSIMYGEACSSVPLWKRVRVVNN